MSDPTNVLFARDVICTVTQSDIDRLKQMACKTDLKRARLCMHLSPTDLVQEMLIVLHRDTYVRPHRHIDKSESFHVIEGSVAVGFFDDEGNITQVLRLSSDKTQVFMYRMSSAKWHTVIPMTEYVVLHEVVAGPHEAAEFPSWEPERTATSIRIFKQNILSHL